MGKNWAGPFFPHPDKASTLCRWLSGWRKTRLVRYFPTLTSENINHTLLWICKQPLLFRGWGKTGLVHSFPTLTSVSIKLVQKLGYLGGEKLGWSIIFPPWQVKVSTLPCHEYANNLCFLGGGEKMGRPILSPPWQDKATVTCVFMTGKGWLCFAQTINHLHNSFLPPDNLLNKVDVQPCQGKERMGRPSFSPPPNKQL